MNTPHFDASMVKELRAKLGMTIQEFAHEIKSGIRTVSNWESGKVKKMSLSLRANCVKLKRKADKS